MSVIIERIQLEKPVYHENDLLEIKVELAERDGKRSSAMLEGILKSLEVAFPPLSFRATYSLKPSEKKEVRVYSLTIDRHFAGGKYLVQISLTNPSGELSQQQSTFEVVKVQASLA